MRDEGRKRYMDRCRYRTQRHGHWRAIVDFWNGLCAQCGEEMEQLHEPFGENGGLVFQQRVPLCGLCHMEQHHGNLTHWSVTEAHYLNDISREIDECGSYRNWCMKYNVAYHSPQTGMAL